MTALHNEPMSPRLTADCQALTDAHPGAHAIEAAQLKLTAALRGRQQTTSAPPRRARWLAFAATATAALALILLPVLLSERGGSAIAFADVQRHFREFSSLTMTVEQSSAGTALPHISVLIDADGRVRSDLAGEISVVVDPNAGQVLMLLHSARSALRFPIDVDEVLPAKEALNWIDELRTFQGIATALPETRLIDGQTAHGWSLGIGGARIQLWATADGLPLTMSVGEGETLDLQFRFRFDAPIDPGQFSTDIPAGYNASFGG